MTFALETATRPARPAPRRDRPGVARRRPRQGHAAAGRNNHVQQVRLHIVEFRGFEMFIEGRPYWEVPVMVQRLCGICPVSHHLAASKAMDRIVGVRQMTPSAVKLRRLMHYGQMLQSHALHFFHLSSPDLLFGFDSEVARGATSSASPPPIPRSPGRACCCASSARRSSAPPPASGCMAPGRCRAASTST